MAEEVKAITTMPGTVEKIIKPMFPGDTEKAQISVEGCDHLYKEIRLDNSFTNRDGDTVGLKKGAEVNVTVEADPEDTVKKWDAPLRHEQ